MFKLLVIFALTAFALAQRYKRPLVFAPRPPHYQFGYPVPPNVVPTQFVNMCTYTEVSFEKCIHTTQVARNNSIDLPMQCIRQNSVENCIDSVRKGISNVVVLADHGYKKARSAGLKPFIYAREDDTSLYIAVAPRNITLLGVQEAPIYLDYSKDRAFHAAALFNLRMNHDICSFVNEVSLSPYIAIADSVNYVPNSEEILICPDRTPAEFTDYKTCNIEASLQSAVFIRSDTTRKEKESISKVFNTIDREFGADSKHFNFFDTFQGQDDVIFKNKTIAFDSQPTYRNGVDEEVFNKLHCNIEDQSHDPRELL